ncbi:type VII secretion integral membrane protein EccD [Gordonia sihwensis]|uniref:type VII secretion integral membrane protein EccD n=1 Tax=Gordonia sihwensis TaxID=173559 RepID=UPI003D97C0E0
MADDFIDLSIKTRNAEIDLPLSEDLPVRALLGDLVRFVQDCFIEKNEQEDDDRYAEDIEWISDRDARWSLVTPLNVTLRPSATLRELGVKNGDTLKLVRDSVRVPYANLIDDTPEAIARYQRRNFPTWERPQSRILTLTILAVFGFLSTGLGVYYVAEHNPGWSERGPILGAFALAALTFLLLSSHLSGRSLAIRDRIDTALATILGMCGYTAIVGLGQTVFPGGNVVWGGVISAALLAAVGMLMLRFCHDVIGVHYGAIFVGINILLTGLLFGGLNGIARAVSQFQFPLDTTVGSIQLAVTALGTLIYADRLAMSLSAIPMPYVPTIGEDFVKDRTTDLSAVPLDLGSEAIEAMINQEPRVLHAYRTAIGFFAGGLILLIGSVTTAMATLETHPLVAFVFSLTIVVCMVYRGRSYDDAAMQGLWLGSAALTMAGVSIGATIAGNGTYLAVAIALAAAGVLAACVFSLTPASIQSPLTNHKLEIIETILYTSLLIDLALIMEVWQSVRSR